MLFLVAAVAAVVVALLLLRRWQPPGPGSALVVGGVLLMVLGGSVIGGFVRFGAETLGARDWWIALPAGLALGAGWRCFAAGSQR